MSEKNRVIIEPSILACDFTQLSKEVEKAEAAGADAIHIDVMDGHFVPNLSMGPKICAAVNRVTKLPLDVHLMIYNPYNYIEQFIESGADSITIHFEATEDVEDCLEFIRKCNIKAGLAFCPETSESMIPKFLPLCDRLLLMTVHPGFGGQTFMEEVLPKITFARSVCDKLQLREGGRVDDTLPPFAIQVDGGIDKATAKLCAEAGANEFVAGTALYGQTDMEKAITEMRDAANEVIGWY